MSDNNDIGSFFAGFMIGSLVGAAVALLMAPQSGEETRTLIKDKSIEIKDKAVVTGQDALGRAEKALEDAKVRADAAVADLRARTDELAQITKERAAEVQKLTKERADELQQRVQAKVGPTTDESGESSEAAA
jgi:gas vesicle protein